MLDISEKDIYYFVMYPETLEHSKKKYIQKYLNRYIEQITFLEKFKVNLEKNVPTCIINNLNDKINNSLIIVDLKPIHNLNNSDYLRYAANSPAEIQNKFYTFQDESKRYLMKINSSSNESKIFLFGANFTENCNISFQINPSCKNYNINYSEQPLIVNRLDIIESIQLSLSS